MPLILLMLFIYLMLSFIDAIDIDIIAAFIYFTIIF